MKIGNLTRIAAFVGVATTSTALQVMAQAELPVARVGQRIVGVLTDDDPLFDDPARDSVRVRGLPEFDSVRVRAYRFDAAASRAYLVVLSATAFDAELLLTKPAVAGLTHILRSDRHARGGNVSRIVFRPTQAGPFLLVVGAAKGGKGAFTLEIRELPAMSSTVRAIAPGQRVEGVVSERDPILDETGTHYTTYEVNARAGQRLRLTLTAGAFDPWVDFGQVSETGEWKSIRDADKNGLAEPESLAVMPRTDGKYHIRVIAVGAVDTGSFALRVEGVAPRASAAQRPILVNTPVTGDLEDGAAVDTSDFLYDDWIYNAGAGERLVINLSSTAFDTYLAVGRMRGQQFEELADDDDGGTGMNSSLELTTPDSGAYVIRVRSADTTSQRGEYLLRVDRMAQRPPAPLKPTSRRIEPGEELTGTLDDADARLEDGSPYEEWILSAKAGDRIIITMRAQEFDAFLMVGQMERGEFAESARDDDGAGERDARVVMVAPKTGDYVVRANTFGPTQHGNYTLKVERAASGRSP